LVRDIIQAAPTIWPYIESINNRILTGEMYKALKEAKRLIAYEQKLIDDAKRSAGIQQSSNPDLQPA
jgi:flagellar protein FlbT